MKLNTKYLFNIGFGMIKNILIEELDFSDNEIGHNIFIRLIWMFVYQ